MRVRTALLLSLLAGCAAAPQRRAEAPAGGPDLREVDALFAPYAAPGAPGAGVLVLHGGRVALSRGYGLGDLAARTPVTPETRFRLASLTKQFTAAAVLLLAGEGRLGLDARVADLLPGLPPSLGEVRVRHLLTHTSGVWDYEAFVPPTHPVQVRDRDVPALLARAGRTYFPPGTAARYSNSAYALLALLVEHVSGRPFAAFLRERVFTPAGMPLAVAHEEGVSVVAARAWGYAPAEGAFVPRDQSPTSAVLGDGGVYASLGELAAWYRTLDAGALLPEAALREAVTPVHLADGTSAPYGFGWFVDTDGGRARLSHHGETCGFTNAVVRYPEAGLTVVVLTNRAGGEPWRLAQRLADLWLGPPAGPPPGPPAAARPWPFESMPNAR
jgi:CubicO group peptidase (beta-lactamase class C family)